VIKLASFTSQIVVPTTSIQEFASLMGRHVDILKDSMFQMNNNQVAQ